MAHPNRILPAVLLAFGGLITAGGVIAQAAEPAPAAAPPSSGGAPSADAAEESVSFPILAVSSIEILRSTHAPTTDIVLVNGLTSSEGWEGGELVPLRHNAASDGVLDLVFVAHSPTESGTPSHYTPIQATMTLPEGHPFSAVRIRSATNSVVVRQFPGFIQAKVPAPPCDPCIGKLFVAKGATAPAGAAPGDIVNQDSLPALTRIVRPDDGVADARPNPNRLTLIIGDNGRIVDAAWE
jgi:hypothetical protein